MTGRIAGLHAIVPAGGSGTRLWPLSRAGNPKFLLDLTGEGRSLLQGTYDRLMPLTGADGVTVVTGALHGDAVVDQLPGLDPRRVVREPSPRDSMPAIALATALVAREDPSTIVGSFAADHAIPDTEAFADTVRQAVAVARAGYVCTIGVLPTGPSTAYGYVEEGDVLDVPDAPDARRVERFVEKPDPETARTFLESGRFRWNAGMFVCRASLLLDLLAAQLPQMHDGVLRIADSWGSPDQDAVLAATWPGLTKIAIDHALAEPVSAQGRMATVRGDFAWSDIGDFAALADLADTEGIHVIGDPDAVQALRASGIVVTGGRAVSVVGLDDVVVVDTPTALLVTTTEHAQLVRSAVEQWRDAGRDDLL